MKLSILTRNLASALAYYLHRNKMRDKFMASQNGGGKGLYFILGALVVAVAVMAYLQFAPSNEPDLSIDFGEGGIEVETN